MVALGISLQTSSISLPAYTAYLAQSPIGAELSDGGTITGWASPKTQIEWGGYFAQSGSVHIMATVVLAKGNQATYRLMSNGYRKFASITGNGGPQAVDLGALNIRGPAWRTFWLQGLSRTGGDFGTLLSLNLSGDAVNGAKFNLKSRRNSASVHLLYPTPKSDEIAWFYNEVTAKEDPVDTYYMACGFSRGYFGMQVNGPHERRVIFSIWDSGHEPVSRSKVAPADQVQLLGTGTGVFAGGFGNEGTGGHSHLVYNWLTGKTQKFLVHAQVEGTHTVYTAYFYRPDQSKWSLIASFSAPQDGHYLHGLYSFVEDFGGDNGNLKRKALYGPAWIKTESGPWEQLTTAKFSHDATGGKDRFDYDFGVEDGRFFLQNGGFQGRSPTYGTIAKLNEPASGPPRLNLDSLPGVRSSVAAK
jgi:hypothetical protein